MTTLQDAVAAMENAKLEAMQERNAAQLKREFSKLTRDETPAEKNQAFLEGEAIKRRQALLDTVEDKWHDEDIARSRAEFGKQPPPNPWPTMGISKKGSY